LGEFANLKAVNQRGMQIMRRQFCFYRLSALTLLLFLALTNFSTAQDKKKTNKYRVKERR